MASIRLEALRKVYPGGALALAGLDLEVTDGELLVLVGPSGCGKSTALRLVAGLEDATEGRVWLAGRDVTGLGPGERDLAMVFQSYALYPHKTVAENLAFPLRMRRRSRSEIERRVGETAAVLGLSELLGRRPRELSGGERQRVALGRAMVREPAAFLLDEPLSNLDARLRVEMRAELARLHRRLGATMILVTHDQEEAMILGGRIAVLRRGRMEQLGAPEALYARPDTLFVARFLGAPAINTLRIAELEPDGGLRLPGGGARLGPDELPTRPTQGPVVLAVRPEDVELATAECADLVGRVEVEERLGRETIVHVVGEAGLSLRVLAPGETRVALGEPVGLRLRRDRLHLFDPESGQRLE